MDLFEVSYQASILRSKIELRLSSRSVTKLRSELRISYLTEDGITRGRDGVLPTVETELGGLVIVVVPREANRTASDWC